MNTFEKLYNVKEEIFALLFYLDIISVKYLHYQI